MEDSERRGRGYRRFAVLVAIVGAGVLGVIGAGLWRKGSVNGCLRKPVLQQMSLVPFHAKPVELMRETGNRVHGNRFSCQGVDW
eukprot:569995-Pleurochrysis_carterae.AAC.1